jgi:hypothetical protein
MVCNNIPHLEQYTWKLPVPSRQRGERNLLQCYGSYLHGYNVHTLYMCTMYIYCTCVQCAYIGSQPGNESTVFLQYTTSSVDLKIFNQIWFKSYIGTVYIYIYNIRPLHLDKNCILMKMTNSSQICSHDSAY